MSYPKIGHINFLNILPLTYSYYHGYSNGLLLTYDVPSVLNNRIKNNQLDISMISSVEYARMSDNLLILPDVCIRADCDVESIVLISKKKIEDIKNDKIILTSKSATSHCLVKIILSEGYDANPVYQINNVEVENPIPEDSTAALLIGDDALYTYLNVPEKLYCYDIGKEWHKLTRRSMVYALWVVRKEFADKSPELLQLAYDRITFGIQNGLKNKNAAINFADKSKKISYNDLDYYLGNIIKWNLNDDGVESLITYYKLAHKLNLIENVPEIKFAHVNRNTDIIQF